MNNPDYSSYFKPNSPKCQFILIKWAFVDHIPKSVGVTWFLNS